MDAPEYDDLHGVAAELRAPLYPHPQTPVAPVRKAYYLTARSCRRAIRVVPVSDAAASDSAIVVEVEERSGGGLRSDAKRNRERLLVAARTTFAQQGLDVSLRRIAQVAGVSEPTLRRRFASKEQLVAEAFEDKVAAYADAADAALAAPDPWVGFTAFLEAVVRMQLVDHGFAEVLTLTFPPTMRCERERRRAYGSIESLISAAQASGRLRGDFVAEDIVLVLLAHAGLVAAAGPLAERMSARFLAYLLEAFGAPGASRLPASPSVAEVYRALLRLHDARG